MSITVQNLFFAYEKSNPVLENISFSIRKGEFIGIFGPNGGGKTTLLKLLLGLLKPQKGTIKILENNPEEITDRLGYVPQMRRLDKKFPLTVHEVVLQGCLARHKKWGGYSKEEKDIAMHALELVGLQDKAKIPFGKLSGGQIQRTLIARAMATDPEILFLDEAIVGIDPKTVEEILTFLIALKGKVTIIFVTHDLQATAREMNTLFCIQRQLTVFTPEQVCEHFALGLYHPPLMKREKND